MSYAEGKRLQTRTTQTSVDFKDHLIHTAIVYCETFHTHHDTAALTLGVCMHSTTYAAVLLVEALRSDDSRRHTKRRQHMS